MKANEISLITNWLLAVLAEKLDLLLDTDMTARVEHLFPLAAKGPWCKYLKIVVIKILTLFVRIPATIEVSESEGSTNLCAKVT